MVGVNKIVLAFVTHSGNSLFHKKVPCLVFFTASPNLHCRSKQNVEDVESNVMDIHCGKAQKEQG